MNRRVFAFLALLALAFGIIAYWQWGAVAPVANATPNEDFFSRLPVVISGATGTPTPTATPSPTATPTPTATPGDVTPPPLAFPGAEGFGANAVGGRGGAVIEVTNLNDSGPGSLRAAVNASGPRIVVFRVGGTIELQSLLEINNPYITIAGQTAPGDGITLKGQSILNVKETHDVVIRHIRLRNTGVTDNRDSFNVHKESHDVIIDHCSASWSTDEVLSASAEQTVSHNLSIQWCIISEALLAYDHSMGSLISAGTRHVSVHHNLYAHNDQRNPKMKGDKGTLGDIDVFFDFVNNIIYNWDSYAWPFPVTAVA